MNQCSDEALVAIQDWRYTQIQLIPFTLTNPWQVSFATSKISGKYTHRIRRVISLGLKPWQLIFLIPEDLVPLQINIPRCSPLIHAKLCKSLKYYDHECLKCFFFCTYLAIIEVSRNRQSVAQNRRFIWRTISNQSSEFSVVTFWPKLNVSIILLTKKCWNWILYLRFHFIFVYIKSLTKVLE